ncbi:MAG TPA: hypothetical protein VHX37_16115 [Acidobacteriaceae bacterium]|jgi:hypothetical protein|nr:hypothetical protein [Acidobacteriaceae bacterium]
MILALRRLLVCCTALSIFGFLSLACGCGSNSNPNLAGSGSGSGSGAGGSPTGSGGSGGPTGSGGSGTGSGSGTTPGSGAYVYVSLGSGAIQAYSASSSGGLTPMSGSPFPAPAVNALAGINNLLFAVESGQNIVSFSIGSTGAITQSSTINAQALNTYPTDGGPLSLFTDPRGQDVYDSDIYADGANSRYQAFAIQSGGSLTYSGVTSYGDTQQRILSFTADGNYAYGSDCYRTSDDLYGFMRNANGSLTWFDPKDTLPAPPSGEGYCISGAAVSPDNHLVVALGESPDGYQVGNSQLAVYTINPSDGTLTTTDTTETMPTDQVGYVNDYRFDPTGATLAVAGQNGLEIYGFSAGKLTAEGGALTSDPIAKVEWDSSGNLYALSTTTGKLYVFSVASGAATAVSGSPYAISSPGDLAVVPVS